METLADHLSKEFDTEEEYDVIDEADKIIEETYQYMGLKKEVKTTTTSSTNFILKNGKAREEKISNSK